MTDEMEDLREEVARLTAEVERLTKVVSSILAADQRTQEELKRCWRLDASELERVKEELAVTTERLAAAEGMLIEVYRHVGNSSPKRHALPPGLRDQIRDYTKANCPERAGWLPAGEAKGESG